MGSIIYTGAVSLRRACAPPPPYPRPLSTQPAHKSSLVERRKPRTLCVARRGHGPTALPRAPQSRQLPSYHPSLGAGLREEHVVDEVRLLEAALGREPSLHEQRLTWGEIGYKGAAVPRG